jgi:transposase InsO family protein
LKVTGTGTGIFLPHGDGYGKLTPNEEFPIAVSNHDDRQAAWTTPHGTTPHGKYCLVIVDDYSRFTWVFFLQEKSQTQETLKGFLRRAQNEFGLRIKKIRSDNGTEFKNSQIEGFLEEEGIKHKFSSPYTPQQNGVVERKNRTLLDMARTMLDEYKTLDRFWAEAVNTACYAINRLYLHRILKKTSYELLTGKKPNVSYFRVFGSKCFILVKRGRKSKFAPKAV